MTGFDFFHYDSASANDIATCDMCQYHLTPINILWSKLSFTFLGVYRGILSAYKNILTYEKVKSIIRVFWQLFDTYQFIIDNPLVSITFILIAKWCDCVYLRYTLINMLHFESTILTKYCWNKILWWHYCQNICFWWWRDKRTEHICLIIA